MAFLIAGPTASGKSAVALALAEASGGVVVNADAMQVYRDLEVLTARPTAAEEARAPHRLYGHVDAATAYSVTAWLDDLAGVLEEARQEGRPVIIVGGTGLYLEALTEGLSAIPQVPGPVRDHWRAQQARASPAALHAVLRERDPAMAARLRPSDPQRIVRALEVLDATGHSLAHYQGARSAPLLPLGPGVTALRLTVERAALRAAIAARFEAMIAAGAVEEAARLVRRGLDPSLPAMKAIGVRPLADHAAGRLDRASAVARAVTDSQRYAKRQDTWLNRRFAHWPAASPARAADLFARAPGQAAAPPRG